MQAGTVWKAREDRKGDHGHGHGAGIGRSHGVLSSELGAPHGHANFWIRLLFGTVSLKTSALSET